MNIFKYLCIYKYILTACSDSTMTAPSPSLTLPTTAPAPCRSPINMEVMNGTDTLYLQTHTLLEGVRLPPSMKSKILHPRNLGNSTEFH